MKKLTIALASSLAFLTPIVHADYVQPNIQHEPFTFQHVVYQLNTADEAEQIQVLRNAGNHIKAVGQNNIELRIVVFAGGISALNGHNETINKAVDQLRQQGVKIAVCNNTLKAKNLDWHTLYGVQESDIVPAGVAELAFLQQRGFTYIHP